MTFHSKYHCLPCKIAVLTSDFSIGKGLNKTPFAEEWVSGSVMQGFQHSSIINMIRFVIPGMCNSRLNAAAETKFRAA